MKLTIKDYCIRCTFCSELYPDLFEMDEENDIMRVKVEQVPEDKKEMARKAMQECAVTAIIAR